MAELKQFDLTADQRALSKAGVYELRNFRLTEDQYYMNDRGWEQLKRWPVEDNHVYFTGSFEPCRFLSVFKRHGGAETYYLYERDGRLAYETGVGESDVSHYVLANDVDRHIPGPSELGTQLIEVGDMAIICNGYDQPFKFFGKSNNTTTPFSWQVKPSAPTVYDIDPSIDTAGVDFPQGLTTAIRMPDELGSYLGFQSLAISDITWTWTYYYSYISDTGSESPMSNGAVLSFTIDEADAAGRFVSFMSIPPGPPNTKSINRYRTHNITLEDNPSSTVEGQAYLLDRVMTNVPCLMSDFYPDSMLTILAPTVDDQGFINPIIPIGNFGIGTIYDNRLWLSGGDYRGTVIYSDINQIETFRALNYFPYPQGGEPFQLVAFAGYLLIFREHAIDYISKLEDGSYRSVSLTIDIGTRAGNTIKSVPGVGLVFLSDGGFYAISHGPKEIPLVITKISETINDLMSRLTTHALARATAVYNPVEKEYWCHFPADGWEDNVLGCVLHSNGAWTTRGVQNELFDKRPMMFNCLACDGVYTVIGATPYDETVGPEEEPLEDIAQGTWHNLGLMVWSASPRWGYVYADLAADSGGWTTTQDTTTRGASVIETNWLTLDSNNKKRINYLELICLGTGYGDITCEYATSYRGVYTDAGEASPVHSSFIGSELQDVVYDTATIATPGQWDISTVSDYRVIRIRYDIGSENTEAIKFKITSSSLLAIQGFAVGFTPRGSPSINQQARARY